jgi:hypothetical protein
MNKRNIYLIIITYISSLMKQHRHVSTRALPLGALQMTRTKFYNSRKLQTKHNLHVDKHVCPARLPPVKEAAGLDKQAEIRRNEWKGKACDDKTLQPRHL